MLSRFFCFSSSSHSVFLGFFFRSSRSPMTFSGELEGGSEIYQLHVIFFIRLILNVQMLLFKYVSLSGNCRNVEKNGSSFIGMIILLRLIGLISFIHRPGNSILMDMELVPITDPEEFVPGTSEKGNAANPTRKPRKKSMPSAYLKFFKTAPDGKSRSCTFCKQSYSMATATGNLGRHLNNHHPGYSEQGDSGQQQTLQVVLKKSQFQAKSVPSLDVDHLNLLLVNWLIGSNLPPSTLDDEFWIDSFMFLNFSVQLCSRQKLHTVTTEVFRSMREDVRAYLHQVSSKVSITLDFWSSCEQVFYMSVEAHWIDENWSPHSVLLDVCHIPVPCGSLEIFLPLTNLLRVFDLNKIVLSCTHDGSQPAHEACRALKEEFNAQKMHLFHIPCAARILNQIIEDHLKCSRPILSKVREFVFILNSSAELSEEFRQLTTCYQEGSWNFPLDSSPRWTGDYTMLDIIRKASNSVDAIIGKHKEIFGSGNPLLGPREKSSIFNLHTYLDPFHKITSDLCACKVPTAGLVFFFMDHVFEMITSLRETCHYEWLKPSTDDMAKTAINFSNQVYNPFTYIAAILDPRIKRELVPESLNTDKNLEEARNHFFTYYSSRDNQFTGTSNAYSTIQESEKTSSVCASFAEEIVRKRRRSATACAADELTQYLSEPLAPMSTNVLEWWKGNNIRYPQLSVMARDYLAVHVTAVEPDKLFSSKGDNVQKQRYCLSHDNMRPVLCIQSWARSGYKFSHRSSEIDYYKLVELSSRLDRRPR